MYSKNKQTVYIQFSTIYGFRHILNAWFLGHTQVLEYPVDKAGLVYLYFYT